MTTNSTIRKTSLRAIIITAFLLAVMAFSAASVYAVDAASITEVKPDNPEVNKEITVKAQGNYTFASPSKDWVYFRVTGPGSFHEYQGVKRETLNLNGILTFKFTPTHEGAYLIEVCLGPHDSSGNHIDLNEKDFIAEGSRDITVQKDISKANTVIEVPEKVYTGGEVTPEPVVTVDEKTLDSATDYDISYENNINAGEATLTITGKGFYKGSKSTTFQILPASITEAAVTGIVDRKYGSKAGTQNPRVVLNEKLLVNEQDYVFACENYENAGTATVVITGTNNYTGEIRVDYTVNKVSIYDIGDPALTDKTYTGSPITLDMDLWYGRTLVEGEDYTVTYENNVNPGTATVTITGIGNFKDTKTRTFTIKEAGYSESFCIAYPKDKTEFDVNNEINIWTYILYFQHTGYTPDYNYMYVRVLKDEQVVGFVATPITSPGENNVATFTPTSSGEYIIEACRTKLKDSSITGENFNPMDSCKIYVGVTGPDSIKRISKAVISGVVDKQYTGDSITQTPTVTLDGKTLVEGTDYYVTYKNTKYKNERCINVGTIELIVHGIGKYTGTTSTTFQITPRELTEDMVTLTPESFTYTGELQKPTFTVKDGIFELGEPGDFRFTNDGGTEPGEYGVSFRTGDTGNYVGEFTKKYTIKKWSIDNAVVTADPASYVYDGTAKEPAVSAMLNGIALPLETDFDISYDKNTDAGTAKAIITAKAGSYYTGSASGNFTIEKRSITEDGFTVGEIAEQTYNRSALTPVPEVTWGERKLNSPEDFTMTYENNVNAGIATAKITGTGNFKDFLTTTFTIGKKDLSDESISVEAIPDQEPQGGSPVTPEVVVKDGNDKLTADDFSVEYSNNDKPGTASVTITGKGNYKGTIENIEFTILRPSIKDAVVTVNPASCVYNGTEQKPTVSATLDGVALEADQYNVNYEDNKNAGNAKVTITAKDDSQYRGSASGTFTIEPADISTDAVTVEEIDSVTYNKTAQTPEPELQFLDTPLVKDTDYTLAYEKNINAGEATITITGKGNFNKSRKATFVIEQKDLEDKSITVDPIPPQKEADGSSITPEVTVRDGGDVLTADDFDVEYEFNDSPGTAYVTITGKGNYTGSIDDITFEILDQASYVESALADKIAEMEAEFDKYPDSDKETIRAALDAAKALLEDYNTTTGELEQALDDLTTLQTAALANIKVPLDGAQVTTDPPAFVYDRNPKEPAVSVTLDGVMVPADMYTVTYEKNVNAGTAKVTVTAVEGGHYTGTASGSFTIQPKDIGDGTVTVDPIPYQKDADGSPITPEVIVRDGRTRLTADDFTAEYKDNDQPGTASVTITGKGNYTGTIAGITFEILEQTTYAETALTDKIADMEAEFDQYPDSDKEIIQAALDAAKQILADPEKTNEQLEQALDDLITLQAEALSKIELPIDGAEIEVDPPAFVYDGTAKEPDVYVTLRGVTLPEDKYTVDYENNVNAGTAKVTVTAAKESGYSGRATASFTIQPKDIKDKSVTVDPIPKQRYKEGAPVTPAVTLRDGKTVLTADDFTVEYKDNDKLGTATVTITGKGNYTGVITGITFEILETGTYEDAILADKIAEIEGKLKQYLDSDQAALRDAIDSAREILASENRTPAQLLQLIHSLNQLQLVAEKNLEEAQNAEALPTMKETEESILAQDTDRDPDGSTFAPLKLRSVKQGKKNNVLTWTKVNGAAAYVIYGNKCGNSNRIQKIATVKTNKFNHTKLKKGKYYKYVVVAVKDTVVGMRTAAVSRMIHVATAGGKNGNFKSVKVPKKVLAKAGKMQISKPLPLKAKAIKTASKARVHTDLRYQSSDESVAQVDENGVITAVKTGSCTVYIYAQNGVFKSVSVTVVSE